MFIAFIFTTSLDYKKARKMDYDLLNACVALAQELAHSEACAFWSPLGPREAVDLSQQGVFFSLFHYSEMRILQTNTKLYAVEKNCNRL